MKMSMKDITVAACGAFAAIAIGINWWVPISAFAAQLGAPQDEIMQDSVTSFQTWNGASAIYMKQMDVLYKGYGALKTENAQLKDELAKAKAAPPTPAPAPNNSGISTQGQHGDNTIAPKP